MKKGTSLYLDLVRFSAALMVFLVHLKVHAKGTFGPFWSFHLDYSSQTAVTVFFVLSGYVIAHVLATREGRPLEYCASRFARLYSVVVPALILTALCNYFIEMKYADSYPSFDSLGRIDAVFHYLGTGVFLSSYWLWSDLAPPNAGLFWSLSFEVTYYVGIALFVFTRGGIRFLSLVLLAAAAGPTAILMAPTWLLGYGAYHFSPRWQPRPGFAAILWLACTVLLMLCPLIEESFRERLLFLRLPDRSLGELLAAYAAAMSFALSLLAFNGLAENAERLFRPFTGLIRWLGSITFALYLFQYPLLTLFAVYSGDIPPSLRLIWLVGGTFLIVATLGRLCEQSKAPYKRFFLSMWRRAAILGRRYGAQTN